ncbi:uncharacterized protein LY89DRAFT_782914 [Mollisia scopiformis]|uniref:RBR-type E3 ubiquitin transferase n=1 Tax=Mollisia scopiformis TaxID=149040 RepID=A0A194X620_MOLSC|nr:uncharacterized protein LY89DRAFT_782914 [Mollisia scopiformis]KUJ15631.1 hypothetical protein LY89DRAFT_782914 [Mollisia scopiformis]
MHRGGSQHPRPELPLRRPRRPSTSNDMLETGAASTPSQPPSFPLPHTFFSPQVQQDLPDHQSQPHPGPSRYHNPHPSPFTFSPRLPLPRHRAVIPAREQYTPSLRSTAHIRPPNVPSMESNHHSMTHQARGPAYFPTSPDPQTYNGPQMTGGRSTYELPPLNVQSSEPFSWQLPAELPAQLPARVPAHFPVRAPAQLPAAIIPPPPAPKVERTCTVCMEDFGEDMFPHKCTKCTSIYCKNCLRSWFLDACRNESKMPPKCCTVIPLSAVNFLTPAEIELFKLKFEEWSTPGRLYCPEKKCSAFISTRLYIKPTVTGKVTEKHVSCPECGVSVCTKCRALAHIDNCPESDLDPALEEQLKKWKIKRCPKCLNGVRRVFGCAHIECRCGAHFCWECLQPIGTCDGSCEDSERDESEPEEDDLDGRAGYYDGDDHDFGPEPYGTVVDAWSCQHVWVPTRSRPQGDQMMECHLCYRHIQPVTTDTVDKDEDSPMTGMTWQCAGAHMICSTCVRPPESLVDKSPTSFVCWCGTAYCHICDRNEKVKELETAYECTCGMMLCGACKNISDRQITE